MWSSQAQWGKIRETHEATWKMIIYWPVKKGVYTFMTVSLSHQRHGHIPYCLRFSLRHLDAYLPCQMYCYFGLSAYYYLTICTSACMTLSMKSSVYWEQCCQGNQWRTTCPDTCVPFKKLYTCLDTVTVTTNISILLFYLFVSVDICDSVVFLIIWLRPGCVFYWQAWTTTDLRSMNTVNVSFSTSSLLSPATTTSRSELDLPMCCIKWQWGVIQSKIHSKPLKIDWFSFFSPGNSFSTDADERDKWQQDPHH